MAREWLLRGVDPEELKPDKKIEAPATPKGWLENFWYHHKWTFLGGVFLAVILIVLVTQLITRDTPDYHVVLMTKQSYLQPELAAMEDLLAKYGEDLDGDGKVEVTIQNCRISKETNQQHNSSFQIVQAHLMAGDVLLFAWDESAYELFMGSLDNALEGDNTFLTPLPAATGVTEEGTLYDWTGDPRLVGLLENLPDTVYFGVRDAKGTAADSVQLHKESMDLLTKFMEGRDQPPKE